MQYIQIVKKVSPPPKPILRKASCINVTEILKPNIAFCIFETHKREIRKARLLFFFEDGYHMHYFQELVPSIMLKLLYHQNIRRKTYSNSKTDQLQHNQQRTENSMIKECKVDQQLLMTVQELTSYGHQNAQPYRMI